MERSAGLYAPRTTRRLRNTKGPASTFFQERARHGNCCLLTDVSKYEFHNARITYVFARQPQLAPHKRSENPASAS